MNYIQKFTNLSNGSLVVILESFEDYFLAMRFVLSFKLGFYGSLEHKRLLKHFTVIITDKWNDKRYMVNGKFHREFGLPAIDVYSKFWYKNGKCHSIDDAPSVIHQDNTYIWHNNGRLHREKLPAIIYANGSKFWYRYGKEYRGYDNINFIDAFIEKYGILYDA